MRVSERIKKSAGRFVLTVECQLGKYKIGFEN